MLITTVKSSGVSIDAISLNAARARLEYFPLISVNVYATSADVNGRPSCQRHAAFQLERVFQTVRARRPGLREARPTLNFVSILMSVS